MAGSSQRGVAPCYCAGDSGIGSIASVPAVSVGMPVIGVEKSGALDNRHPLLLSDWGEERQHRSRWEFASRPARSNRCIAHPQLENTRQFFDLVLLPRVDEKILFARNPNFLPSLGLAIGAIRVDRFPFGFGILEFVVQLGGQLGRQLVSFSRLRRQSTQVAVEWNQSRRIVGGPFVTQAKSRQLQKRGLDGLQTDLCTVLGAVDGERPRIFCSLG